LKGGEMKKQRIEYGSTVDALVAIAKHLSRYELRYKITSEDFYNRINLSIRIRFNTGYLLELNEAVIVEIDVIKRLYYRYHFQDELNTLVFRYDNAPHFPDFVNFPHHKHLSNEVIDVLENSIFKVIDEAKDIKKNFYDIKKINRFHRELSW